MVCLLARCLLLDIVSGQKRECRYRSQKLRVGICTEEVLEWFNCPHARAHPAWMRVSYQGGTKLTCIIASPVLHRGQPDGGESYIVLLLPSFSNVRHLQYMRILCCKQENASSGTMDGCKAHQNDCSFVCGLSGPFSVC